MPTIPARKLNASERRLVSDEVKAPKAPSNQVHRPDDIVTTLDEVPPSPSVRGLRPPYNSPTSGYMNDDENQNPEHCARKQPAQPAVEIPGTIDSVLLEQGPASQSRFSGVNCAGE